VRGRVVVHETLQTQLQEVSSVEIGFVGLGRMGTDMSARIHRDPEHRDVATDDVPTPVLTAST
jgi:hypothetical protein